jgi:pimeloyl-ACP methyl ester carboxylesterase
MVRGCDRAATVGGAGEAEIGRDREGDMELRRALSVETRDDAPIVGPTVNREAPPPVEMPRLARHLVTLDDGHQVGVAVCGEGVPLVVVHGFTAEGILYAQTLSRLVDLGFKIVAIDMAGHGGTLGLPTSGASMTAFADLLGRSLDHLGIRRAVFLGHSMGGRLVTQLVAEQPERAIAVISVDGIVGHTWDQLINISRFFPPLLAGVAVVLVVDTLSTVPLFGDREQAAKLLHLVGPTLVGHVRRPWRLIAPAVSVFRSRGSGWMLDKIRQERIPFVAMTGQFDIAVPARTAVDAARRANGELVVVRGGTHSWLLKDPESLPAIMHALMKGRLGTAVLRAISKAGLDPHDATLADREAAFVEEGSLVAALTPELGDFHDDESLHPQPRYRFTISVD